MNEKDFSRIRQLCLYLTVVFGLTEIILTFLVFHGLVAFVTFIFVTVQIATSLACIYFSKHQNKGVAGAAIFGDIGVTICEFIVCSIWLFAATSYQAASQIQSDYHDQKAAYAQSKAEAAAGYQAAFKAFNDCRGRSLAGFNRDDRGALMGGCGSAPNPDDYKAALSDPGSPPSENPNRVAYEWKDWIRWAQLVGSALAVLTVSALSIYAFIARHKGGVVQAPEPFDLDNSNGSVQPSGQRGGRSNLGNVPPIPAGARAQDIGLGETLPENVQGYTGVTSPVLNMAEHRQLKAVPPIEQPIVPEIGLERLGKGIYASPDLRPRKKPTGNTLYTVNRDVRSSDGRKKRTVYLVRVRGDELEKLQDGRLGREWLEAAITGRRRNGELKEIALEALAA